MNLTRTTAITQDHAGLRYTLVERILQSTARLFNIFTIYMGHVLGFYQALATTDYVTSTELAREAGFQQVVVLPIDNFFFRFYRLHG